jgi:sugar phosphate permease
MLVLYILLWSLFTGVMGLAVTFAAVLALRFGCGLAQAGAYPTSGGVVSKCVPFSERGMASGIVSLGGRVGGAATPVLTAYLILAFVSVSVSSLLTPGDLLDVPGLCERLEQTGDKPSERLGATIQELLPPGVLPVVRQCATEEADSARRILHPLACGRPVRGRIAN